MRRSRGLLGMVLTIGIAAMCGAVADAATPPGAPQIRVARAADQAGHPGAHREWWTLRLLDPRSAAMVELRFVRSPDSTGLGIEWRGTDGTVIGAPEAGVTGPVTASSRELRADGPQGRARLSLGRRRATVALAADQLAGTLSLRALRPGPRATGIELGEGQFNQQVVPQASINLTMPIARSAARGTLVVAGRRVRVDGWRATYEHGWGELILEDDAYDMWDAWTVHDRSATWVAFGLNRTDTVTGPGARDAMWLGVLARVGARSTTVCRPRIHRRGWRYDTSFEVVFATRLEARCGNRRARFGDLDRVLGIDEYPGWFEADGPARVGGRGDGWVVHRGTS